MAFSTSAFHGAITRLYLVAFAIPFELGGSSASFEGIAAGNSYTQQCGSFGELRRLLDHENETGGSSKITVFQKPGASINSQKPHTARLSPPDSNTNKLLAAEPDFLILQDQSQTPALGPNHGQYQDCREGVKIFWEAIPM